MFRTNTKIPGISGFNLTPNVSRQKQDSLWLNKMSAYLWTVAFILKHEYLLLTWRKKKDSWPSVCPGVGNTSKLCLPKLIWSSGLKSISALAPLLRDIIDWQPGNKLFSFPVPVIWSACICVFTAKGVYPNGYQWSCAHTSALFVHHYRPSPSRHSFIIQRNLDYPK